MNKNIFEKVSEAFVEYCADYYESGFRDEPEGYRTAEGFLDVFKWWLNDCDEYVTDGDDVTDEKAQQWWNDIDHVLEHFDEVGVEELEEGVFIPVLK